MTQIVDEVKYNFDDLLLRPKRSSLFSRKNVSLERTFKFKYSPNQLTCVPIIASNMDGVGTLSMAKALYEYNCLTALVKYTSKEDLNKYFDSFESYPIIYTTGMNGLDWDKFQYFKSFLREAIICVDNANGYTEFFSDYISKLRDQVPNAIIIAGNVVTADMTSELLLKGADVIKVGIGPGSGCTTRLKTGVGYPQVSAIMECADAAHGLDGHIVADGGCVTPGDVAKAFAAGGDFVMLGGMLAGHDEGEQETIEKHYISDEVKKFVLSDGTVEWVPIYETKRFIRFYGMSSQTANEKYFGGLRDYRTSEGREVLVPYRGSVKNTIQDILGGLRSTCTYVGAKNLKSLPKCSTFVKCNDTHNRVYES